jgi:polyhydroxyalkanoate synthesis regulator phasin
MKQTSYEIGADYAALVNLVQDTFIDPETGEAKEATQEEKDYLQKCFMEIKENAETKFDNIGKLIRNIEFEADLITAQKDIFYKEVKRLRKRITAHENQVKGLKGVAAYLLEKLDLKKIKTPLFSFGWQKTAESAKTDYLFNPDNIPVKYLKRELSPSAIKEAVKLGELYTKEGDLNRGKLFYLENGQEKILEGVTYLGGEVLVMRQ